MAAKGSSPRLLFNRAFALTVTAMVAVFFGRTLFGHGNPIFDELNRGKLYEEVKHTHENQGDGK